MKKICVPQELLSELYTKKRLSTFQIADKIGCCQATIWKRLKQYGIHVRLPGSERINITKEHLERLYLHEKLSTWQIERKLKIPRGTVHRKLREFSIPTRDLADSHIIHQRKDFSENLIEKAYLIGFRLGDLGVRKVYPNSKTICVATGSTIKEQIDLVSVLFEKYGRVWIKKSRANKINTYVNLNLSFSFLLNKEFPAWVEQDRSTFFSFLAGFSDAEGTISISKNRAYYSLGNYDHTLLRIIHTNLRKFGINCNEPTSDHRKGEFNSQGYPYRSNYWTLRMHKKEHLLKLLQELKPYLKHKNKVISLNKAISNLEYRNRMYGEKCRQTIG